MRLGTCIALELALGCGAIGGAWLGVGHAVDVASDYFIAHEAAAATPSVASPAPTPLPGAQLHVAIHPPSWSTIFDQPDEGLLAPLGATPVTRVKINHGGTSLSLRLDFESGARAAFKPGGAERGREVGEAD